MVWSQHYASTAGLDEAAHAVAFDQNDNVFITGRGNVASQGSQMLTIKLAGDDGDVLWTDYRGGTASVADSAWDVAVGPDGHPVVAGMVVNTGDEAYAVTRKLDSSDGSVIWENLITGAINDIATRGSWLVGQDNGDVVRCERAFGATGYDILLARYAGNNGDEIWAVRYDGPTSGGDDARAMTRDAAGNLIIVGVQDTFWNYNYMVLKFDGSDGGVLWQAPGYDGPPGWYDEATCVTVAGSGEIVVSGLSDGSGTGWDIATLAYDPASGAVNWTHRIDGTSSQTDQARDVAVAADGMVYVTGYSYGATTGKDLLVCRLTPATGSAVGELVPLSARLIRAWPNPFNPKVNLAFAVPEAGAVRLAVHDLRGRRVKLISDDIRPAGDHTASWNGRDDQGRSVAAGVYFVIMETVGGTASQKIVLVP